MQQNSLDQHGAAVGSRGCSRLQESSDTLNSVVVDISAMAVSDKSGDVLVSYSLGSCLGVAIYDPQVKVGGVLHAMLPLSRVDAAKAQTTPCMFVDTGMNLLLRELFKRGVRKSRAIVKLAGSSRILDRGNFFRIGQRNHAVCRKILWKNNLMIAAEDIGGDISRTIRLEIDTGRCSIKTGKKITEL